MEGWDYAQLTKKASEVGGPEALIRQIGETNRELGRKEGYLHGVVEDGVSFSAIIIGGQLLWKGCHKVWIWIKDSDKRKKEREQMMDNLDRMREEYLSKEVFEPHTEKASTSGNLPTYADVMEEETIS